MIEVLMTINKEIRECNESHRANIEGGRKMRREADKGRDANSSLCEVELKAKLYPPRSRTHVWGMGLELLKFRRTVWCFAG
jgi:hypothetical protein